MATNKYRFLTKSVAFDRIPLDYIYELAILLETPGLRQVDLRNWFERKLQIRTIRQTRALGLDVTELAKINAASVTEADAWAMLALTPHRSTPSVWARALIRQEGVTTVAQRLGAPETVVRRWSTSSRLSLL